MSMKVTSEFSPEKLLEFISDKIYRLEIILDGYFEANVMNPQDTLAMKNLYSSLECFYFIENWIKLNVLEEEDSILDNTNDDL
jgi:hypothetical protein